MSDRDESQLSRRDFLLRASQAGVALTILTPALGTAGVASAQRARLARELGRAAASADVDAFLAGMRWRMLGPFRGGRVAAVSGVPGRRNDFYMGAVNGGVWKTTDAGRVWNPVFDAQPVASIGAIAVAPSAPHVVYVGTGESTLRDSVGYGNGMYRSSDSGKSWTHIGLADTQHIGKIAVHPRNPDVLFVAAIGHLYASNAERGVFRSTNGGRSWKKVLFKGDDVGAVEVVIDPNDPRVVYAGLWNTRRPPWFTYAPTNGPGGGIWKSADGGDTWRQLANGLPASGIGRTGIAVAPSNSKRVYAVVDCLVPDPNAPAPAPPAPGRPATPPPGQGGLFRSDDAGATWRKLSGDPALWGRGWYFEKITVDPKNADIVYVPNVAVNRSMDGGKSWVVMRGSPGGDDYHQAWINPDDTNTMIVASDQGAVVTHQARAEDPRTITWSSWLNQPTAQLYHVSVDYRTPYWVTAAQQDSGAIAVRSRGKFAEVSTHDWEPIGAGGESGYTAGDPLNPGVIFGGMGNRYDLANNLPMPGTTAPKSAAAMRADWTQPLVFSKADPRALYYGSQFLFRTTDGAKSWTQLGGDLTRQVDAIPATLDATAAAWTDRNGKRGVIYSIAPSPVKAPTIWIGTDDGLVQLSTDDGMSWRDVTPSAVTPWSRVTMLQASHFDEGTAYASVDRHQLQDFEPYIYRTRDMGKSWQRITNGLPAGVYVHCVKEDPRRRGLLVAGTERGAFVSLDDGESWRSLQSNLPATSVRDFEIHQNDLIVATHGRGFWVLDDISALRQMDASVLAADAHLFKPADGAATPPTDDNGTPLQKDEPQAPNPPAGVAIDYWLRGPANGPVTLTIADASGKSVATYSSVPGATTGGRRRGGGGAAGGIPRVSPLWQQAVDPLSTAMGLHRVVWSPVVQGAADGDGNRGESRVLTGTFTATLNANGRSQAQTFVVGPDPRSTSR